MQLFKKLEFGWVEKFSKTIGGRKLKADVKFPRFNLTGETLEED